MPSTRTTHFFGRRRIGYATHPQVTDQPREPTLPDPRPSPLLRAATALLLLATVVVAARRLWLGDFTWTVWGDRDLARSAVAFAALPTTGAELSYGVGAGTPGGAFGILLWLVGCVSRSPQAAWWTQITLDTLAAALLGWSVTRRLNGFAGAVAAATWLSLAPNAINQSLLWNPAWLSIFLALAAISWVRVVVDHDARFVAPWALMLALAAQMHVTAGVLALAMLPGLLLARPGVRALFAGLASATLAYAPYLAHEVRHGFENTHLLLRREQIQDLTQPLVPGTTPLSTLWSSVLTLGGAPTLEGLPSWLPPLAVGLLAVAGPMLGAIASLWAVRSETDRARRTLWVAVGVAIVVSLACLSRSRAYQFQNSNTSRYLLFLLPLIAWAAALAADGIVRMLVARPPLRALAVGVVLLSSGVRLWALDTVAQGVELRPLSWTHMARWTDHLREQGALLTATANTTFFTASQKLTREKAVPIESIRQAPDAEIAEPPPGTPCRFVVVGDWPDPAIGERLTPDSLSAALAPDGPRAISTHVTFSEPGLAIGSWTPESGPCPSNLTQRYLLTRDEKITAETGPSVPHNSAIRLDNTDATTRWLVSFDPANGEQPGMPVVYALITLNRIGDAIDATLASNQLRGVAWNGGFFQNARVRNVRLVARGPDDAEDVLTLASGVVGRTGVSTPLFAHGPLADAELTLRVDLQPDAMRSDDAHDGAIVTLDLPLP